MMSEFEPWWQLSLNWAWWSLSFKSLSTPWSTKDIHSNGTNGFATRAVRKPFHCITGTRKIRTIHTIGLSTVIPTIILSTVITTVSISLMWGNRDKRRPIRLPWVWSSPHFPFVITSPTFGNDWESYCCQWWQRWYRQSIQSPNVERVTQCVVDSTKILGYVTVEYYRLYYSNIRSYLIEYISRYSDSTYAAV
jgi:hypothetical protein